MGVRRVVTGHDESGRAIIISDADAENIVRPGNRPGVEIHNLWVIDSSPAAVFGASDATTETIGLLPPQDGSVFRIIDFPPERDWIDAVDAAAAKEAWASLGAEDVGVEDKPAHPLMHRTETVDYSLCLEGEMYLVLDDSELLIKKGDAVIQRGTNHAWSNRSDAVCTMMFVLVDGTFETNL